MFDNDYILKKRTRSVDNSREGVLSKNLSLNYLDRKPSIPYRPVTFSQMHKLNQRSYQIIDPNEPILFSLNRILKVANTPEIKKEGPKL